LYKDTEYKTNSTWEFNCNNCTCIESIPVCEQIKCKYETCEEGKLLVLNDNNCCPVCEEPKKSCHYDEYLIQVYYQRIFVFFKLQFTNESLL